MTRDLSGPNRQRRLSRLVGFSRPLSMESASRKAHAHELAHELRMESASAKAVTTRHRLLLPPIWDLNLPHPGNGGGGGGGWGGSTPGYHDRIALEARLVPTNLSTTPTNLHTNLVEAGSKAIVSPHVSPAPTATVATEPYSSTNLATEPYTPSSPSEAVVRAVNVSQRGAPASHQIMQIGGNTHTHTHTHTKHKHMYIIYIYIYKYIYTYIYIHGFALENADRG